MGLAEKRAAEKMGQESVPAWKSKIAAVCGTEIELVVNWDKLIVSSRINDYPTIVDVHMITPLIAALSNICVDDLGKKAFKEKINKIVLGGSMMSYDAGIKDGTLTFTLDLSVGKKLPLEKNGEDSIKLATNNLTKLIERNL